MNEYTNKRRIIRELTNGKKRGLKKKTFDNYNWTVEEKQILKQYIIYDDNVEINTTIQDAVVSKFEIYNSLDKHVKNSTTLLNYKSRVNALIALMQTENQSFSDIFIDIQLLISSIKNKYKDPTSYFAFLLYILSKDEKLNRLVKADKFDLIKKQFDNSKNKQLMKQLDDRNADIEYENIYNSIFKIETEFRNNQYASMKHLISLMYSCALYDKNNIIHMNPRNYFVKVKFVQIDSDMNNKENFYNYNSGKLVINDYKTAGIYEPYVIYMNDYVKKTILQSFVQQPRTYLIEKVNGGLYAGNSLSEMIQRTLKYSIDTIRKSIESYEINIKNTSRDHVAHVSRHTIITQTVSYLANA